MPGVTFTERKSTNWIQKQTDVTDTIKNIREKQTQIGGIMCEKK